MIKKFLLKLSILIFCLSLSLANTTNAVFIDPAQINNNQFTTGDWTPPSVPGPIGWTSEIPPEGNFATGEDLDNYITCSGYWSYDYISNVWGASTDEVSELSHYIRKVYYKPTEPDVFALIYTNDHQIGEYASQASGIADGIYEVEIAAVDIYGNQSAFSPRCRLTVDKTAPYVKIDNPLDGQTVSGTIDIRGTVTDVNPHHYWLVVQTLGGAAVAGPGVVSETNSFTDQHLYTWDTTSVADGDYVIKLEARDAVGNKQPNLAPVPSDPENLNDSVDWITVVIDNVAPQTPFLIIPGSGVKVRADKLYLDWSDVTDLHGPVKYEYRLYLESPGSNPAAPIHYQKDYYEPISRHPASGFAVGTPENDYWWRVRACDQLNNCSPWTLAWHFLVDNSVADPASDGVELPTSDVVWNDMLGLMPKNFDDDHCYFEVNLGSEETFSCDSESTPIETSAPGVNFYFETSQKAVGFKVSNISQFSQLNYEIIYDAGDDLQGITGTVEIEGQDEITREDFTLGTCSTGGTCVYHSGIDVIHLKVTLENLGGEMILEKEINYE